jgi:methylmalonyl-CoA mutase cobalamin-binding subunit
MVSERIVVGACGGDEIARATARRLRDAGHEVIFVGGGQTPEALVRTAVAEDASSIVVDADQPTVERIVALCAEWDIQAMADVTRM